MVKPDMKDAEYQHNSVSHSTSACGFPGQHDQLLAQCYDCHVYTASTALQPAACTELCRLHSHLQHHIEQFRAAIIIFPFVLIQHAKICPTQNPKNPHNYDNTYKKDRVGEKFDWLGETISRGATPSRAPPLRKERIPVNCPESGGTVPIFAAMSRCPAKHFTCPEFLRRRKVCPLVR